MQDGWDWEDYRDSLDFDHMTRLIEIDEDLNAPCSTYDENGEFSEGEF